MRFSHDRLAVLTLVVLLVLGGSSACSDDDVGIAKGLAPLVGVWRADTLVLTNEANPSVVVDLIEEGAEFTLSILGDGRYQAVLKAFGQENLESGNISVSGDEFVLSPAPSSAVATTGTWAVNNGVLTLDGVTEFDFNQDGSREAALVHIEFHLRGS